MTFYQRLINTLTFTIEKAFYHIFQLPTQRRLYKKYFPNARRSLDEILKSSAVIFLNNHVTSSSARPYLPNMIEIEGIHVNTKAQKLAENFQSFLDSASDGVILFSMGSIIQSHKWPIEKREALVRAFSKIKQKVIWKYENETLPGKPENVMISSWVPQNEILAHPNVKLFITHGGRLGTIEATHHGVPVLGIPIYADQKVTLNPLCLDITIS